MTAVDTFKVEWTDKEGHESVESRKVSFMAGKTTFTFFKMPIETSVPVYLLDVVPLKLVPAGSP